MKPSTNSHSNGRVVGPLHSCPLAVHKRRCGKLRPTAPEERLFTNYPAARVQNPFRYALAPSTQLVASIRGGYENEKNGPMESHRPAKERRVRVRLV